jgi:hypothetical protein
MKLCYIKMRISSFGWTISENARLFYVVWYSAIIYSSGSQSGLCRLPVGWWNYLGEGAGDGPLPSALFAFLRLECP